MGKLNGRFLRMQQWLHDMDFEIFGNNIKSGLVMTYLTIVGYSYIVFPFLTLLLWGVYMFKDADKLKDIKPDSELNYENPVFLGGVSIYLIGIGLCLILTTFKKIAWNNYRFKLSHMVIFCFAYAMFTAWQFTIMFSSIHGKFSFQGISACFLTQSGMLMCAFVYLNLYENKFNLIYFLDKFVGKKGEVPDPKRENNMLQEIEGQKADEDWLPNIHDIKDVITIGKISEKKMMNAFGRGFQRLAMDNSACVRYGINGGLLLFYAIVLFVYAYLVYDLDDGSKLGIVSVIAVVVNDIYVFLMYNARIV